MYTHILLQWHIHTLPGPPPSPWQNKSNTSKTIIFAHVRNNLRRPTPATSALFLSPNANEHATYTQALIQCAHLGESPKVCLQIYTLISKTCTFTGAQDNCNLHIYWCSRYRATLNAKNTHATSKPAQARLRDGAATSSPLKQLRTILNLKIRCVLLQTKTFRHMRTRNHFDVLSCTLGTKPPIQPEKKASWTHRLTAQPLHLIRVCLFDLKL